MRETSQEETWIKDREGEREEERGKMLDIVLFREDQGGNPNLVRESQRRRFKDVKVVDTVIELDTKWRAGEILFSFLIPLL